METTNGPFKWLVVEPTRLISIKTSIWGIFSPFENTTKTLPIYKPKCQTKNGTYENAPSVFFSQVLKLDVIKSSRFSSAKKRGGGRFWRQTVKGYPKPETNSSPLNIDPLDFRRFLLETIIFMGELLVLGSVKVGIEGPLIECQKKRGVIESVKLFL